MARKLVVEIIGDSASLERAFRRSSAASNQFGRDMGRVGRGALAATVSMHGLGRALAFSSSTFLGGAGAVFAVKSFSEAASNMAEQLSKANVVFGSSSRQVQAFANNALGLARDQALETAAAFGALLRPMGITEGVAATLSERLTKLGVDLASFSNTSVEDALQAIRSGLVGEVEPLRRYGVLLTEARVQQEALRETGKKHAQELAAQEKVQARLAIIFKDTTQAQGDFARTSGGLANQQRALQANIRNLEIAIGQALNPAILEVTKSLNSWISKSENQKSLVHAVKGGVAALTETFRILHRVLEDLNGITGSTKNTLKLLLAAFVAFKTAKIASSMYDIARNVGLIGTNATAATGGINTLRGRILLLTKSVAGLLVVQQAIKALGHPGLGIDFSEPTANDQIVIIGGRSFIKGSVAELQARQAERLRQRGFKAKQVAGGTLGGNLFTPGPIRAPGTTPGLAQTAAQSAARVGLPAAVSGTANIARLTLPDVVRGSVSIIPKLIPNIVRGVAQVLRETFEQPIDLQLAQAKAAAQGRDLTPILKKMKAAAERAIKSGRLSLNAQIEAWNGIAGINDQLKGQVTKDQTKFRHISVSKLLAGTALSLDERRHIATALAQVGRGGTIPQPSLAFGGAGAEPIVVPVQVNIDGKPVTSVVTKHQRKAARRRVTARRGPWAGRT